MNKQIKYAIILTVFVGIFVGTGAAYYASHMERNAVASDVHEEPANVKTNEEKLKRTLKKFIILASPKRYFAKDLMKLQMNMKWIYG